MNYVLLLGAGFSHNWGGFLASEAFDYLLGCPEILNNSRLQELLWKHQQTNGFEDALAELQVDFNQSPGTNRDDLVKFQEALLKMYQHMNNGFFENPHFEFQNLIDRSVKRFLTRFDAIFTLNQDLLLEHHYIDRNVNLLSRLRWYDSELPGMKPIVNAGMISPSWAQRLWIPIDKREFRLNNRYQPYIKLHGSSNWRQAENESLPLLILGGEKASQIKLFPVLDWYHQLFKKYLFSPETHLMVIGYGFGDLHINEVLEQATEEHNLKMFIVGPKGVELPRNSFKDNFVIKKSLMGSSTRKLSEIFGNDTIEYNKILRFFNLDQDRMAG